MLNSTQRDVISNNYLINDIKLAHWPLFGFTLNNCFD